MALWCPQRSMPASLIPATTEAAVRRPPWGLSVSVLRAGLALRAPRVSPGFDPCPFSVRGWVCGGGRGSLCRDAGLSRPHVISVPGLSLWEGLPCLRQPPKSARAALRGRGSPGKAAPFARSPWSPGSSGLNPGGGDSPRSPVDTTCGEVVTTEVHCGDKHFPRGTRATELPRCVGPTVSLGGGECVLLKKPLDSWGVARPEVRCHLLLRAGGNTVKDWPRVGIAPTACGTRVAASRALFQQRKVASSLPVSWGMKAQ